MREFVIFFVVVFGGLWAFDVYALGGRYSHPIWQPLSNVELLRT
jgi:hypothetical protein